MRFTTALSFCVASLLACSFALAGEVKEAPTLMTLRGKALLTEDFAGSALPAAWKVAKGTWTVSDGALKGAELASDNHPAVVGVNLATHDLVAQFDFKLDGAKSTAFSLNNAKGHVCRVTITPAGFSVQRDKPGKTSEEKAALLARVATPFAAGQWYTMLVEVRGQEMVASVGEAVGYGANAGIDTDKTTLRFPAAGETISIAHLRVWEAAANPAWDATKAKLEAAKKAAVSSK